MKNNGFLCCRYKVKTWLKSVCRLKCKSNRAMELHEVYGKQLASFSVANLYTFYVVIADNAKRIWILLKNWIDRKYLMMCIKTHNALTHQLWSFIQNSKFSKLRFQAYLSDCLLSAVLIRATAVTLVAINFVMHPGCILHYCFQSTILRQRRLC